MEIIKQGFLTNLHGKKVYAVFCIRNNEPLLEIYAKKIHSSTHLNTQHVLELKKTKYVGLKIPRNISESCFEFVIVLATEVFSFSCKRQDLMNDWVNCLKTKLRELKVLSPKENIYTKPPAMRPILQMTRNPRDPLPEAPQIESSDRIPGLEVLETARIESSQSRTSTNATTTTTIISTEPVSENENTQIESIIESFTVSNNSSMNVNNNDEDDSEQAISIPIFNFATSNTSSQNLINLLSNPLCRYTSNNADLQFTNSFNYDEESDEEDMEEDNHSNESEKAVLPTSLNIEYNNISEENDNLISSDNNITIIPIESNVNISNNNNTQHISKLDESKVTKIKIEVEYNHLCKALSSHTINNQNGTEEHIKSSIPSTSSFIKKNINNIEKESAKSVPNTPKRILPLPMASSSTSNTPKHEKRKLSLREQQVLQLRHEIKTDEIRFKLRKKDCVDAIAFASYNGQLYIAGFKPNPQLYVFHIGDQLLAINNIANIKSSADAHKFIKMCAGLFVEVTIKRLPFAGIFVIKRDFENQCLGLIRDGSSLLDTIPNSVASKSGIPSRPYTSHDDDSIFWVITEINFRPLSLISHKKYDETELLLNNAVGLETSLLLQPSDFIAKIKKELKAMKNYRDYTLQ